MRGIRRRNLLLSLAGIFLLLTAAAHAADDAAWKPSITTGGALILEQDDLNTIKTVIETNDGTPGERKGGFAVSIVPAALGDITSVTANGLTVDGYTLHITDGSSAFGALQIMGVDPTLPPSTTSWDVWIKNTNFTNVNLTNNTVNFTTGTASGATPSAFGGAFDYRSGGDITYAGGTISGNHLTMEHDSAVLDTKGGHANGGGMAIAHSSTVAVKLSALDFLNNIVTAKEKSGSSLSAGTTARGGALYLQNTNDEYHIGNAPALATDLKGTTLSIADTLFQNNLAENLVVAGGNAFGGAINLDGAIRAEYANTQFIGNTAKTTDGQAWGGAIRADIYNAMAATTDIGTKAPSLDPFGTVNGIHYWTKYTNVDFENNSAINEGTGTAQGGALHTATSIYLSGVTFKGNKTVLGSGAGAVTTSNAIHLGSPKPGGTGIDQIDGGDDINATTAAIFADAAGSASYDYDGISSDNSSSAILKTGAGDLHLYGNYSNFSGATTLENGTTYFMNGGNFQNSALTLGTASTGAIASLENATAAGAVTFNSFTSVGTGNELIAKAFDGGTVGIGNSAYFVTNTGSSGTDIKFGIAGKLKKGLQYLIAHDASGPTPVPTATITGGTERDSINALYGTYAVMNNSNTVWAELTGDAKDLNSYSASRNGFSLADYLDLVGRGDADLLAYIEDNYGEFGDKLTDADVARLLDLATGEAHAAAVGELARYSTFAANQMLSEAHGAWNAWNQIGSGYSASAAALGSLTDSLGVPQARIWGNLNGYTQNSESDSRFDADAKGLGIALGADRVLGDFLIGAGFRYGNNAMDIDALENNTDFDSYTLALYGGYRFATGNGEFFLDGGLSGTFFDIEGSRGDGRGGRYDADYDATSLSLFADAGYSIDLSPEFKLQPFANGMWTGTWTDDFTETKRGGTGNALSMSTEDQSNFATTLGARGFLNIGASAQLDANLGWRHTFGDEETQMRAQFAGLSGGGYTVYGGELARNEAVLGAGVTFRPSERVAIRAGYDGAFGGGADAHQGSLRVAISF